MSLSFKLDAKKTAVIFIEFQNEFTSEGGKLYDAVKPSLEHFNTLENAAKLLKKARASRCKVIHCPISFEQGHEEIGNRPYGILKGVKDGEAFTAGTWNADFIDSMKPEKNEFIVKGKVGLDSFHNTNLDSILRRNAVEEVVLCGFLANCCVESTMRTAYENGYNVYTVKDACAATSVEEQDNCFEHNFGMFSVPTTTEETISSIKVGGLLANRNFGIYEKEATDDSTVVEFEVDANNTTETQWA
mmetsp:Transcript_29486/g.44637  ORF Transcript_29486/g.44637 Transcript_29486/m.44637 type:complete len:245 (+) Transcript_29486:56-790(+)